MRTAIKDLAQVWTGYQTREGLKPLATGTHFIVQAKDIDSDNGHVLLTESLERITPTRDAGPFVLQEGDILFLSRGRRRSATLVESIPQGSLTLAAYYFFIVRVHRDRVDPGFLAWVINEEESQAYLEKVSRGTAMPFVAKQSFIELRVNLPAISTQRKIRRINELGRQEWSLLRELQIERRKLTDSACKILYEQGDN